MPKLPWDIIIKGDYYGTIRADNYEDALLKAEEDIMSNVEVTEGEEDEDL